MTEELGGPACNCMLGKSGPFYFLVEACTPKYMGNTNPGPDRRHEALVQQDKKRCGSQQWWRV